MSIIVLLSSLGALILSIGLASLFLPNFDINDRYKKWADKLSQDDSKSKGKRSRLNKTLAYSILPALQQHIRMELIFGKNIRKMQAFLSGGRRTFNEMLADNMTWALLMSLMVLVIPVVFNNLLTILIYPITVIVLWYSKVNDIRVQFRAMQREIQRDLPLLIDKMMLALETGTPFIKVFNEMERHTRGRMKKLLTRLNNNIVDIGIVPAVEEFARETTIPVMMEFSAAVKIGTTTGYEEAKAYLDNLKDEIQELRRLAIEQITRNRPKRVGYLYAIMIGFSLIAVGMAMASIFKELMSM
jgi:Flp pilus assembly protein TadB